MTDSRSIGLVLVRAAQQLGSEPFFQEFIAGLEGVLNPEGMTVVLQVVATRDEELETYRRWAGEDAVDVVLLVDLGREDPRVSLLESLQVPTIIIGDPQTAGAFTAVWTDDAKAMRDAVAELDRLGHRTIGRIAGPAALAHTQIRSEAFARECTDRGIESVEVASDYSEEGGGAATKAMLSGGAPPTAIVYDNDLMALGGLDAVHAMGLNVPEDLSVVAWDDSALCQLSDPPLAVMGHDVQGIGELAGGSALELARTGRTTDREAPDAVFVTRASVSAPVGARKTARAPENVGAPDTDETHTTGGRRA